MCIWIYSAVINIMCDVIADIEDVNMKTRPLTDDDWALIHQFGINWLPNSPDFNPVDYSIWGALQQLVCRRRRRIPEVLQTCWEQISQDVIDRAIGQFRKRLSLVVASGGGHTLSTVTV